MILGLHNRFLPSVGLIVLVLPLISYLGGTVNFSVHAQTPPCDPNSEQASEGLTGPQGRGTPDRSDSIRARGYVG